MYQFKSDGNDQVFQRHAENQHTGLFQAAPVSYVMNTVPNLAFEMPQPPSGSAFPVYEDMYKCMQQRWMYSLSGIPAQVRQDNMQTLPHVPITRTNDSPAESMNSQYGLNSYFTTKVPGKTLKKTGSGREAGAGYGMAVTGDETDTGSVAAGDLAICQLGNPTSRLMKAESGVGSQKPVEDALQRRELRLLKNREAARECRRKKKEYVRCLENRVAVLEQQNKTLIEELRALKYIYRHKAE